MKRVQTDVMRAAVRERRSCARCASGKDLQAHHMIAIADGGEDHADNIVVLCGHCHGLKIAISIPLAS
jgi:5-methylcytosine-specific restriction endonuclease McrA